MRRAPMGGRIAERAAVTITRSPASSTYDPTTGITTSVAGATAFTTMGRVFDVPPGRSLRASASDAMGFAGQSWVLSDSVFLEVDAFPLGTFVPTPDDTLSWGGVTYTIREVQRVAPGGVTRLYRIAASC